VIEKLENISLSSLVNQKVSQYSKRSVSVFKNNCYYLLLWL